MKWRKFNLIVILMLVTVLCLSVTSFASGDFTPVRARFLGALAQGGANTWRNLRAYQGVNNQFVLMSDIDGYSVAYIQLYFDLGVSSVSSFELRLRKDNFLLDAGAALNTNAVNLYDSNYENSLSIRTSSQISRTVEDDITFYNWSYYSASSVERSILMVQINYGATVIGNNTPIRFTVDKFVVNGVSVEEIPVTETNEGFAEDISNLSQNENEWWQRVVLPDYEDYLDNPDIINQSGSYRLAIKEISFNNFLVPGLISIVFIMAFYGFLLYGKKG